MKRKLFSIMLIILLGVNATYASVIAYGTCGEKLTWVLDDQGTLTISGKGKMNDYYGIYSGGPWNSYRESIANVIINDGVTSIGVLAFSICSSLTSIEIPNSVTSIGSRAFEYCSSLTSITIPNSVTSIGGAFRDCSSLTSIVVEAGNPNYDSRNNCNAIIETATNTLIAGCKNTIIPNGVTGIGAYAFDGCSSLTSVTIPNSVTSIGESAFLGCSSLTSVTIPNGVTSIGGGAFSGCRSLTSIDIPNSVTSIGDDAFWGCSSLTSITIPNSVTSIGEYAFYNCSSLTSATIGNSVTSIGYRAFLNCSSLTSIEIPNSVISIESSAFSGCSSLTSITIPNSVTSIKSSAFSGCHSLTSATIGNSVTSIEYEAFYNCRSLTSIEIPNSVTSIGGSALAGCRSLTSVTIPNSVTSIGDDAFSGCRSLTSIEIPNSVTSIGYRAFDDCICLKTVVIGDGLEEIQNGLFSHCISLSSLYIGKGVKYIDRFAFRAEDINTYYSENSNNIYYEGKNYGGLNILTIVVDKNNSKFDSRNNCNAIIETSTNKLIMGCFGTIIPNDVTSIGDYAFYNCFDMDSINIPNSVTSIGDYAFAGCNSLKNTVLSNYVKSIGKGAFSGVPNIIYSGTASGSPWGTNPNCYIEGNILYGDSTKKYLGRILNANDKDTYISIPNSVTSIGDYAFEDCSGLTSIEIPNSVKSIGRYAFSGCSNLTSVTIPNSVTNIGSRAFEGCSSLTSIYYTGTLEEWCNKKIDVRSISSNYNLYINGILQKDVSIPNSVTSIGYDVFYGCSSLTSIEIPNSVTSIGDYAFYGCSSLTSIEIPNSVTSIGNKAFGNCCNIEQISVDLNNSVYDSRNNCNAIIETATNTLIVACKNTVVPNSIKGIGEYAYSECTSKDGYLEYSDETKTELFKCSPDAVGTISIPNSVTSIRHSAFYGCSGLTSIEIPNSVTSIGNYAFSGCSGLTSIEIPNSVTSIGNYAFSGCSSLTSIEIPNSVTSIGDSVFKNCSRLTSIEIPNSVTSIGDRAFENCRRLTSIEIPNSVTSIGDRAFSGCINLTSIEIPNSVTSIGESAFYGCHSLTSIVIPKSVTNVEVIAFGKCIGLSSIIVETGNIKYDSRDNCNAIIETATNTLIVGCKNTIIPNSVTSIGTKAFYESTNASILIPETVVEIGEDAFKDVSNIDYYGDHGDPIDDGFPWGANGYNNFSVNQDVLKYANETKTVLLSCSKNAVGSISIPNSVTSIGDSAFYGCSSLTSIEIPNSVTSIGYRAFYGCSGLTSIEIPNSVTSIGYEAFSYCSNLTSIEIPNSVTSIGYDAFYGCSGLSSIYYTGSIEDWCRKDNDLNRISSSRSSYYNLYINGILQKDVIIPDSVTSIGDNAFRSCSSLTSIEIPNSVTSIGDGAFYGCSSLTSIEIPNSVTSIGDGAFAGCSSLTSIEIPNSVTSIGGGAFSGCSSLTSIEIPNSVTALGKSAFEDCVSLLYVKSLSPIPLSLYGKLAFLSSYNLPQSYPQLFVPLESVDLYRYDYEWQFFFVNSIEDSQNNKYTITLSISNQQSGSVLGGGEYGFGEKVTIKAIANDGFSFVNWSDGNKNAVRTIIVNQDINLTANFENIIKPCYTTYGSVSVTSEGSYVWFGETYTQSGQYQHTIQNVAGCDSIITLNLTITKPDVPCQTTYGSVSASAEGSYVWFGENYTQSGQYQHTIQNTAGCDSVITLNLTITKPDVPCQTTYGTVNASAEGSYVWYGETYTQSGQYKHTIQNVAGCDSVITLNLTITKPDVPCQTTYGTVTASAEGSYVWYGETYTQSGQYQHTIQNVAGCDSIITLNLTITKPDVPCQTTYGSVSATAEGSYVWYGETYTQSGQYQHTIQNVAGCDSIITLNLTITKPDVPCQTTYGNISATAEGSYVWYGETYTQSGLYQHTIQNTAGCDSVITLNLTITCKPYSFDVHTNDSTKGTIEIIEEPSCDNDNLLILQAVANEHYHFVQWSDGNTDAKREIYLTHDLILNALFVEDIYQVNLSSNNPAYGRVTGSGSYAYGTEVVITAVPGNRYEFVQWSDGNTDNPRTLIVTDDISLQAQFEELYFTITVESNDTSMGTVTGSGRYAALSTATIKAEAKTGYKFIMWNDGNRQAERSIIVVDNETYTAIFAEAITYHIEAVSANNAMGTVTGSGDYPVGAEAVLEAHPKENYQFIKWNDEVTDNPRTIIVTGDARYMAYFLVGSGLEDNELHGVYISGNQIFIDGHEEQTMQIYTITGQTIYSGAVKSQFTLLYNGVYLIRIGNQIAKIVI